MKNEEIKARLARQYEQRFNLDKALNESNMNEVGQFLRTSGKQTKNTETKAARYTLVEFRGKWYGIKMQNGETVAIGKWNNKPNATEVFMGLMG